ncbi:bifunctional 3-(3-hydroxy-phenyl)propionate/3-hydroxycinnamic acid hydroxylase [Streptomyces sp. DT2A-34]|uniref:bifunctional 3-(3-hydroxy-phenyl)propionate/3-hydroxycinnamic acid hydroxylase MhpA n=1 Tax=Streptomyces sp. DT2A-34 TaxID=3051182 RepID=UPI00265B9898|nr:bifunctional 3-(3-hydroxy-phenyl)propionate/3-hydroxycinnamic acid hydroxylase [Streptomyces sp. DT2A-34]MDO0909735.1 bifunctional 3-(3-hydroxy-phenyl)propionate/3-hydroxycinnamic acid hydroxylase [Streptomyces sp. DT2A-34]
MMPSSAARSGPAASGLTADVAVVGCGPVGLVLSILLAHRGWQVVILEKYENQYPFPRVVAFDGETARTFATAGIGAELMELGEPLGQYMFQNGAGRELFSFEAPYEPGRDGWPIATVMHQPTFEKALRAHVAELPNVTALFGHEARQITDHGDHVEITAPGAGGPADGRVTASYVVGCDGANSFVRDAMGAKLTDLGFAHDWLLVDVVFHEPRSFRPNDVQICDPNRPTTIVASGRGHRRWEFMRLPGESVEELSTHERMWQLLAPYDVTPENADLTRNIVYTFQAALADSWRAGRLLLAGDSAHLMPPFAGQGMCSGIRDAANLAWKLDLVLRGTARDTLLDVYQAERSRQVRHTIDMSIEVGRIVSELDHAAAARRDAYLIGLHSRPDAPSLSPSWFALEDGVVRRDASGSVAPRAGELSPQGVVARGTVKDRFDEVVGRGFQLITTVDPYETLSEGDLDFLKSIGTRLVRVLPAGIPPKRARDHEVVDVQRTYLPYLAQTRQTGVLVRPDHYVFGFAGDRADLPVLVGELRERLHLV